MPDKIQHNRQYAARLGWSPGDFCTVAFDPALVEAITHAQIALGVAADGIAGPTTYRMWIDRRLTELFAARTTAADLLRDSGEIALLTAKRAWLDSVIDPPTPDVSYAPSRRRIDTMIRSADGLGWSWLPSYTKVNDFEWCGAFASFAWRAASVTLHWRRDFFSSTYRLDLWARYLPFEKTPNPRPASGPYRSWLALNEHSHADEVSFGQDDPPRAGDILLVGPVDSDYGAHVTLVEAYDAEAGVFTTIEGNGGGAWPDGQHVRGVVRGHRPVGVPPDAPPTTYHARRLIRPAVADLA